jgi:hypothetical protein
MGGCNGRSADGERTRSASRGFPLGLGRAETGGHILAMAVTRVRNMTQDAVASASARFGAAARVYADTRRQLLVADPGGRAACQAR